jgi:glycosyltransferase involved in cell wall biosynthesis
MIADSKSSLPTVSIIIANYNYGRFIQEAIESALGQNHPAREVIIVDDGSTDESLTIIEKYRQKAKVVFKSNGGQASAFNAGLPLATGEIVLFLDSDDYLMPDAVNRIVTNWKPHISRCHFRLNSVDSDGNRIGEVPMASERLSSGNIFEQQLSREGCTWVPTSGNAFSRAVLEKVFPVDERYRICADAWIFYRTAFHGEVLAIEEILGAYRIHDSNNYLGSYVGTLKTDSQVLKLLSSRLSFIHARIGACLSLENGTDSFFSMARKRLSLSDIRELLLSKYLGIPGPASELNCQFTFLRLHTLLLAECLSNRTPFVTRLRMLADAVIFPLLSRSQKMQWMRSGFGPIRRRVRKILGVSQNADL